MIKRFESFNSDIDPYGEEEWGEGPIYQYRDYMINFHKIKVEELTNNESELYGFVFKLFDRVFMVVNFPDGIFMWMDNKFLNKVKLVNDSNDKRVLEASIDDSIFKLLANNNKVTEEIEWYKDGEFGEDDSPVKTEYKQGDKFLCIKSLDSLGFHKGNIYELLGIITTSGSVKIIQYVLKGSSGVHKFNSSNFELMFVLIPNKITEEVEWYKDGEFEEDEKSEDTGLKEGDLLVCVESLEKLGFYKGHYYRLIKIRIPDYGIHGKGNPIYHVENQIRDRKEFQFNIFTLNRYFAKVTNESFREDIDPFGEENWEETDFEKLFVEFLKEKKLYHKYFHHIRNFPLPTYQRREMSFKRLSLNENPGQWISGAFIWDATPDGFRYWEKIYHEWNKVINKYI